MYEFTSPSVTVVRRGPVAGFSPWAVMVAIFCLRASESRREVWTSAWTATPRETSAHRLMSRFTWSFYCLRLGGPTGPCNELGHALLHLLLEDAEARLLLDVQQLVELVVGFTHVGVRSFFEIAQRLQAILQLRFVDRVGVGLAAQLLNDLIALLLRLAPQVLERLVLREELGKLLVADLELLLRLHQRIGVEHLTHLSRRDRPLARRRRRARWLVLAAALGRRAALLRKCCVCRREDRQRSQAHEHRHQMSAH